MNIDEIMRLYDLVGRCDYRAHTLHRFYLVNHDSENSARRSAAIGAEMLCNRFENMLKALAPHESAFQAFDSLYSQLYAEYCLISDIAEPGEMAEYL